MCVCTTNPSEIKCLKNRKFFWYAVLSDGTPIGYYRTKKDAARNAAVMLQFRHNTVFTKKIDKRSFSYDPTCDTHNEVAPRIEQNRHTFPPMGKAVEQLQHEILPVKMLIYKTVHGWFGLYHQEKNKTNWYSTEPTIEHAREKGEYVLDCLSRGYFPKEDEK